MKKTYERPEDAEQQFASAVMVIEALLPLEICPRMKRKFLSNCLWQITQAEGKTKYELRYRSKASRDAPRKQWRHEHVIPRKQLVKQLLAHPEKAGALAATALGCVVTKDEHKALAKVDRQHDSLSGWERYRLAGVDVWDMVTDAPLEFVEPKAD